MQIVKKSIFLIPFLICFWLFLNTFSPFLTNTGLIFSLDLYTLIHLVSASFYLGLTCFFFTIATTLSPDIKIIAPASILATITIFPVAPYPQNLILGAGFLVSLLGIFFLLNKRLSSYLTFTPTVILKPLVNQLATLILLFASVVFYLNTSANIAENGFRLPDSLIDQALQITSPKAAPTIQPSQQLPQIPPQQLQLLKENPQLLTQYGLSPEILNQLQPTEPNQNTNLSPAALAKPLLQEQFQNIIKPYLPVVPLLLAILFFLTFKSIIALFSLLFTPLLWLIFYILEKSGFTKYQIEQREVKKLVV